MKPSCPQAARSAMTWSRRVWVSPSLPSPARRLAQRRRPQRSSYGPVQGGQNGPTITAARRLNRAAGVLAFSVLADSAIEHYRGSFFNRAMYAPLLASTATLGVSGHGILDRSEGAHRARDVTYGAAILTGLVGTTFHVYNVCKRPGGFRWENLFYSAPLGAPSALLLSGLLGFMSERVRDVRSGERPLFIGIPVGRFTAAVSSVGLVGTATRGGLVAFSRRVSQPLYVYSSDTAAGRRGSHGRDCARLKRSQTDIRALVAEIDGRNRLCRGRLPRLWRSPQHGRLAQLASEPPEWPSSACASKLCGFGVGRSRRALVA